MSSIMGYKTKGKIGDLVFGGTAGSVLYIGSDGSLAQDNPTFIYDDTDDQLQVPAIRGGPDTSDDLDLYANDNAFASANTGRINLHERTNFSEAMTIGDVNDATGYAMEVSPTMTMGGSVITIGGALYAGGTYTTTSNTFFGTSFQLFLARPTLQTQTEGVKVPAIITFASLAKMQSDGVSTGTSAGTVFLSQNTIGAINSGTLNIGTFSSFKSSESVAPEAGSTVSMGTLNGFEIANPTVGAGTETITNLIGLNIASLTRATNNYGVYSAMTSGANNYFLYGAGTAKSYFGGAIYMKENTGIFFDSDDTYIKADTNNPENMVISADNLVKVISGSRFGTATSYTQINLAGDMSFAGTAGFYPRVISQDAKPTSGEGASKLQNGEIAFWIDTNDSDRLYLCYSQASTVKCVELT